MSSLKDFLECYWAWFFILMLLAIKALVTPNYTEKADLALDLCWVGVMFDVWAIQIHWFYKKRIACGGTKPAGDEELTESKLLALIIALHIILFALSARTSIAGFVRLIFGALSVALPFVALRGMLLDLSPVNRPDEGEMNSEGS